MNIGAPYRRFRGDGFLRQITVVTAAGVMGVAVLTSLLSSWQIGKYVRESLADQGLVLAAGLAQQSRLALLTGSAENAQDAIDRALAFPNVIRVEVLSIDGRVVAAGGAPATPAVLAVHDVGHPYMDSESADRWSLVAPVRSLAGAASPFEAHRTPPRLLGFVRLIQAKAVLATLTEQLVTAVFGFGIVLATLLLWTLRKITRRLLQPLDELSTVMASAGDGKLGLRAQPRGSREVMGMATVFNHMMEGLEQRELQLGAKNSELARHAATLEERVVSRTASLSAANAQSRQAFAELVAAQKRLVESEKLASLGRLVAGVAHELNTPLGNAMVAATTVIDCQTRMALAIGSGRIRRSELDSMIATSIEGHRLVTNNVARAAEIVRGFKQIAVDQTSEMRRRFSCAAVLGEVLATLKPMFKRTLFLLELELEEGISMDSYPGPLGQVISNIVQNALVHGLDGRARGTVRVTCCAHGPLAVEILCNDDGAGMSAATRERVFDAFFTTKLGAGGSGLGMQIVHNIVTVVLGGEVQILSEPGAGTTVRIVCPREAPPSGASERPFTPHRERI